MPLLDRDASHALPGLLVSGFRAIGTGSPGGPERSRDEVIAPLFKHFTRSMVTPFNLVLEARPWCGAAGTLTGGGSL